MLGVSLPSNSRFLRRINSSALSRSEDSRERRACTGGGCIVEEDGREGRYDLDDDVLEDSERDASCFVIDVRGS